ncbi:flagellar associated protein [Trypanosoma rangeli]|uniref:Flagellar associated protein n=1 Tax=Trypanosoma rangeli TaxID=5698 RepID=A0A3R7NDH9_TRYRA|nr:flagellar associated protein [Trypanosoma rangeli]RNF01059.1 flagellar associated protein [Trypanosoma rangeli]|eukprot:RNF01059.1 flagellar associated protein [Trypanosoma rangeli]
MTSAKPEEVTVSDGVLAKLEREFNEAMEALEGHEKFGIFRDEYENLYRALVNSHESEKRLVRRCQQMTQELMSNAAKMQAAVKLSQGDHSTIEALKKEIEKAWRMVDTANEKDARAKETIKTLKEEVFSLQEIVENGTELTSTQTATLEELKLEKKRMQSEYDDLVKQMETLTRETLETGQKIKELEAEIMNNHEELRHVSDREKMVRQEYEKEVKAQERSEVQVREQILLVQQHEKELKMHEQLCNKLTAAVNLLRLQHQDDQNKHQALVQKVETAEKQLFHTQQSYDDAVDTTEALNERHRAVRKEITEAEKKAVEIRAEEQRIHRVRDHDFKELRRLVQQNEDIRRGQANLERQKITLWKRIETVRREKEDLRRAFDVMQREKDTLMKFAEKEREKIQEIEKLIANEVESQAEIEDAIARERETGARLRQTVVRLESEREKYVHEVSQVSLHQAQAQEELKIARITCEETQKAIDESEQKLKKQQSRYEQVRSERNLYSKKLIEAQDEVVELKQKFRMMDHQILQLREELAMKDKKFQEESSAQKVLKDKLTKVRKLVNERTVAFDDANQQCEHVGQQIKQLVKVINQCDKDLSTQQQRFLAVSGERDLLGTQLIRRNDELALLYEKVRTQQEMLIRGEAAYRARIEDVRLLRLKIEDMKRKSLIAHNRAHHTEQLKADIKQLNYDLRAQKTKVQALTEEAENPKNALRWESISGRDPTPEELEQKITRLQRCLITKSEECIEKDMELQEKQRLVTEMQNILSRQPGMEMARQLNLMQKELGHMNAVMKQKASELNMTSTHISELKYEAERLRRELHETKRKYYETQMSNDKLLEKLSQAKQATVFPPL